MVEQSIDPETKSDNNNVQVEDSPAPCAKMKKKTTHVGTARYHSKTKWGKMYPVKAAKNDQYSFYCIPYMKNIQCHTGDKKNKQNLSLQFPNYLSQIGHLLQLQEWKLW